MRTLSYLLELKKQEVNINSRPLAKVLSRSLYSNIFEDYRLFGLCYAMDGDYKGWNPYIERHLAIFVNCFLSRAN